jgi:hypothetical protein
LYVSVGDNGTILTSSDGTTWTSRTSGTNKHLYGITYANSTFVVMGDNGTILTSSDGTTWTSRTSGTTNDLHRGTYGNSTFVVVGDNTTGSGTILTSPDGTTWTSRTSGTSLRLWDVTYAKQYLCGGGYDRNPPHLFGWDLLDFKDFWINGTSLGSNLRKQHICGGG